MKPHTEQFLRRRKFYMVLPMLVLPFLTMIFWALGGGQGVPAQAEARDFDELNVTLPDAHFTEETWDKLSLYEMAERDSAKYEEARESDPYFDLIAFTSQQQLQAEADTTKRGNKLIDSFKQKDRLAADPNEELVNKKLQELYSEINKPAPSMRQEATSRNQETINATSDPQFTEDVNRLEQMMEMMQGGTEADPEMQQIESVLEKILDIQHPERVKEKLKELDPQEKVATLSVKVADDGDHVSLLSASQTAFGESLDSASVFESVALSPVSQNGFFGLNDETVTETLAGNTIEAIVHGTQELVEGSTVKLRLLNDVEINKILVPKDQFIYGTCAINGERLTIEINSIRTGNSLLPVSLEVYDLDGMPGIYIPGAITRDAAKQASDNALQNVQFMSLDPSLGAQAAAAGVEAAKGLFSKKAKLIKVTVKAGYQIFLKDTKPNSAF